MNLCLNFRMEFYFLCETRLDYCIYFRKCFIALPPYKEIVIVDLPSLVSTMIHFLKPELVFSTESEYCLKDGHPINQQLRKMYNQQSYLA